MTLRPEKTWKQTAGGRRKDKVKDEENERMSVNIDKVLSSISASYESSEQGTAFQESPS